MLTHNKQRGLAAVEASIILPVLLLLLLSIGEFGRMLYQYNTLSKALRAGARTVSVAEGDNFVLDTSLRNRTANMILYGQEVAGTIPVLPGLTVENITFSEPFNMPVTSEDRYITLLVSYDWTPMFGDDFNTFFGNAISLSFPLSVSMTMRILNDG